MTTHWKALVARICTCVDDLLKLYVVFLRSANDQFTRRGTSTDDSPLKQVSHLMSTKIPVSQPTRGETSYRFGWARVQRPGRMGDIACNPPLMPDGMPVAGERRSFAANFLTSR